MDWSLFLKIAAVICSIVVGVATTRYFHMKNDNPIEQAAEEVIKEETGMQVDLSPDEEVKK